MRCPSGLGHDFQAWRTQLEVPISEALLLIPGSRHASSWCQPSYITLNCSTCLEFFGPCSSLAPRSKLILRQPHDVQWGSQRASGRWLRLRTVGQSRSASSTPAAQGWTWALDAGAYPLLQGIHRPNASYMVPALTLLKIGGSDLCFVLVLSSFFVAFLVEGVFGLSTYLLVCLVNTQVIALLFMWHSDLVYCLIGFGCMSSTLSPSLCVSISICDCLSVFAVCASVSACVSAYVSVCLARECARMCVCVCMLRWAKTRV